MPEPRQARHQADGLGTATIVIVGADERAIEAERAGRVARASPGAWGVGRRTV
jgi:hypothetical protein